MRDTLEQYEAAVNKCKTLFIDKNRDYGTSWRVLRPISIIDQIFIKAQRIRTIQEKREQKVADDITSEFVGMVNYGVIGLMQLDNPSIRNNEALIDELSKQYEEKIDLARQTMLAKNHDYGEAWRSMSQESFVDLILMKLMRTRQILANDGRTVVSEGIDANFIDIINYSLFALILIGEGRH